MADVEWMDCPDCEDGKDYMDRRRTCSVCGGRQKIPVDMSERGMKAAGLAVTVKEASE